MQIRTHIMRAMLAVGLAITTTACNMVQPEDEHQAPYARATLTKFSDDSPEIKSFSNATGLEIGFLSGGHKPDEPRGQTVGTVSELAFSASYASGHYQTIPVDVEALGVRIGLRWYADTGTDLFQPYMGAAMLLSRLAYDAGEGGSDHAGDLAGFFQVGVESQLTQRWRASLAYGLTSGLSVDLKDKDGDVQDTLDLDSTAIMFGLTYSL